MAGQLQKIDLKITRGNALVKAIFIVKAIGFLLLLGWLAEGCALSPGTADPSTTTERETLVPTIVVTEQSDSQPTVVASNPDPTHSPTLLQTWTPEPTNTPSPTRTPTPTPTLTPDICTTPGQIITGTYPSQIAGPERNYRVYLPPCYGEDDRVYPTLYMFHGNTHTDIAWDEYGLDEAAEELIQAKQIPPLIIALPDGGYLANNSSGGPNSFEGVILNEFIPYMEQTYCAWPEPEGRAIGGLSRGGYWALEIAFRFPELFVSVGGHSAALYDTAAGPELNPQFTGLTNDLGDLRIYLDIGENDYLIPNIRRLHEDMEAAGRPHLWVLNEGFHEDSYWALHTGEYLLWYSQPWPFEESAYPACQINSKIK